ncbi:2-C-methyl-D-erythritol 4-phosphate cytidylyltransferase [Thalassorhabdus alkalitolerans]|uniref:2-C-methyl-D-erythritol 4-phosphate cytidylyltransferase n=1 Tax=Thalassorhabdus alkalitolerans TaxID=2282697 RepID=A0ABW0YSN2_9BACI
MEYKVVVPAAGQGKRMKAEKNKQFITLDDDPVIVHTLAIFEKDHWCKEIIIVVNEKEIEEMKALLDSYHFTKILPLVPGGKERQDSVYKGLKALDNQGGITLVHDGARPFVSIERVHDLVEKTASTGASVLGVKVKDTVKRGAEMIVKDTVPRENLWAIQTPQGFHHELVVRAYEDALEKNHQGTDDSSLVEFTGQEVHIVEGEYDNIKLTTPEDLIIAKAILEKRKGGD